MTDAFEKLHVEKKERVSLVGLLEELNLPPRIVEYVRRNQRNIYIVFTLLVVGVISWSLYGAWDEKRTERSGSALAAAKEESGAARPDAFSASTAGMDAALPFRKFVTIMQGCNNYCAYCVVPYTRGREISRNVNDILDEVIALVDRGVREITLLGQNVNSYGLVRSVTENPLPRPFPALLHRVAAVRGLRRLRFTTSHPKDLSDDLMQCFRDIPILCPQFHLPVQSGSNAVLKRMNRKYTVESYLEKVQSLRSYCPEIVITTDIIVGFPGEREEDFEETLQLLEKVRFAGSFSFKYSDRPGTRAAAFQDKVPESVKSQRLARFQKRQDAISLEHNRGYIGRTLSVMVESSEKGALKSRSTTNHVVHIETEKNIPAGACISAKIVHAGPHSLQGALKK